MNYTEINNFLARYGFKLQNKAIREINDEFGNLKADERIKILLQLWTSLMAEVILKTVDKNDYKDSLDKISRAVLNGLKSEEKNGSNTA